MALSKEEREQFLAEPHVAALSVSAGDKRGPLTVPIWYQYSPGGEPWIHTGAGSRKHRLIETQGEFTLMVDRVEPTVRYVSVDGPVSRIEPATDEQLVEMVKRYLPPAGRGRVPGVRAPRARRGRGHLHDTRALELLGPRLDLRWGPGSCCFERSTVSGSRHGTGIPCRRA